MTLKQKNRPSNDGDDDEDDHDDDDDDCDDVGYDDAVDDDNQH